MLPSEHYFENCLYRLARHPKDDYRAINGKYRDSNLDYLSDETIEAVQLAAWYVFDNLCNYDTDELKKLLGIQDENKTNNQGIQTSY